MIDARETAPINSHENMFVDNKDKSIYGTINSFNNNVKFYDLIDLLLILKEDLRRKFFEHFL